MSLTFKGGVHVDDMKIARKKPIEPLPAPATLAIPMSQHIGSPCTPLVKKGDAVLKGQLIGSPGPGLSCPIHSSVSGKVVGIEQRLTPSGSKCDYVLIDNDYQNTMSPDIKPFNKRITETSAQEIIEVVKNAGIAGMGGAAFPTHEKIRSSLGKVNTLIVNCAECEPYITANHRLMLEKPETIINGMKILLKAFELKVGIIAVEDNKIDAVDALEEAAEKSAMVQVKIMKAKYPQGDERQLINALTGRQIPAGKLPSDVGCVVFNAETCSSIYNAFVYGIPQIERIVTVSGDCIKNPSNLLVPIGTPVGQLLDFCGLDKEPSKLINGGPMMGIAMWDREAPIVKGTSAILAFSDEMLLGYGTNCIRCGRCVAACPMRLMPTYIAAFSEKGDYDSCSRYDAMSCIECGCCSYICPANIPLVQHIRTAKFAIRQKSMKK
ncbi:MAG: electron transport complex subunit RsxC [Eubacteriales bacterium]